MKPAAVLVSANAPRRSGRNSPKPILAGPKAMAVAIAPASVSLIVGDMRHLLSRVWRWPGTRALRE
jgi:hypothetical protein